METFSSVSEYLEAQRRGRPNTFQEIVSHVEKSERASASELRKLILYGDVRVIVLRFNNRDCPFYTVRHDVSIEIVKGPSRF
jgi:hypothetical protein